MGRAFGLDLDAAPKLDPDPNAAPDPKGVEKRLLPAGVEDGAAAPNKEGVEADPNNDDPDEEGKIDGWGEAPEEGNREDPGAVAGVENNNDEEFAGVEEDEPKRENPVPDEDDKGAAGNCGVVDTPEVPELANNPAT